MFFTARNKKLAENVEKLQKLEADIKVLNYQNNQILRNIEEKEKAIQKIVAEKTNGFPWLAEAISDFFHYRDTEVAKYLSNKSHPAYVASEKVKELSKENRLLRKQSKITEYFIKYYESLFPWITEYIDINLDEWLNDVKSGEDNTTDDADPVLKWIPKAEYDRLPTIERNQKALDRYLSSRKKPYQIGRDYERYIGYLHEIKGFKVEYIGIEKGLEDMGRDLICIRDDITKIVQCKYWSKHKTIHEKHINQLYGTVIKYYIDQEHFMNKNRELTLFPDLLRTKKIRASFITSTQLSETAKKFAETLGVEIVEGMNLSSYPIIKCNISVTGEKIYHLPFDLKYDKTQIKNKGEFYASTVKEAENAGFRRAYRWRGPQ